MILDNCVQSHNYHHNQNQENISLIPKVRSALLSGNPQPLSLALHMMKCFLSLYFRLLLEIVVVWMIVSPPIHMLKS